MKHRIRYVIKRLEQRFGWFFVNGYKTDQWAKQLNDSRTQRTFNNVIVTGGAGFIGSHLVKQLVDKGYSVTVVDSLTYAGNLENLALVRDKIDFRKIDICDKLEIKKLFKEKEFDAILHLAAESHVDNSITNPLAFVETNVNGTVNLLERAVEQHKKNPSFIFYHVSTDEVFGSLPLNGFKKFNEETSYDPRSPYSASKASSDHFVRAYHHTYNLPILVSNCSNNYGTHQYPEKLIPVVIEKIVKNLDIPVYGNGINKRDWLHVSDHADAIITILESGRIGETYCIGGNNVMSNIDLVKKICKTYDSLYQIGAPSDNLITYVKDRKGHDLKYAIDARKMKYELGWEPKISFNEGLEETVKWYSEKFFKTSERIPYTTSISFTGANSKECPDIETIESKAETSKRKRHATDK